MQQAAGCWLCDTGHGLPDCVGIDGGVSNAPSGKSALSRRLIVPDTLFLFPAQRKSWFEIRECRNSGCPCPFCLNSGLNRFRPAFVSDFFLLICLTSGCDIESLIRVSVKREQDQIVRVLVFCVPADRPAQRKSWFEIRECRNGGCPCSSRFGMGVPVLLVTRNTSFHGCHKKLTPVYNSTRPLMMQHFFRRQFVQCSCWQNCS